MFLSNYTQLLSIGVYTTQQTHTAQTLFLKKLGIQCFSLFGLMDIHMWQKGLGRSWWTVRDRIEGVQSAIGTQALDFKSFRLQPFWWPEGCRQLAQRELPPFSEVEEGSIEGPSTRQSRYRTGLVNSYIVSPILGSFLCSSPPSDSILHNNIYNYSLLRRKLVSLNISVNLSQGLLLHSVESCI